MNERTKRRKKWWKNKREHLKKKTVLCFSASRGGRNKPEGPTLQKQAQARSLLHHWLKRLATCVLHTSSFSPSFPVCPLLRHFASMWRSLRQVWPLPIHIFPGMENVNWPVSKTFWSVCHSSRMMEKLMPSARVCVHRRTGDEGKQTNTHKLSRALQPSLCGDGLHLHHVDPMPHSRSAPSPPRTVSSPLASSNWGLPELAGQQQRQQEDAFSWQRAVPLGARRRVHLCQNSTEASKPLKSSELFPVDHTAVLFWWGFYVSINIHGSST